MRRIMIIAALLLAVAGCSSGGRASGQPTATTTPAYHMASPAPHKQQDLKFANELYLYVALAAQLMKQPKAGTLPPAIRQFDQGLTEAQAGYFQEVTGWLRQWNQSLPDVGAPPGPLSPDFSLSVSDVRKLNAKSGQGYAVGFLNLLLSDQQGALQVAATEQEGGGYGPGRQLATEVVEGNTAAIVTIRSMLRAEAAASR
jgi:uncharacterized protein (DUF305 family)